jgi:hypothetical protein
MSFSHKHKSPLPLILADNLPARSVPQGDQALPALFPPLYAAHAHYRRTLFPHPPPAPKPGEVDAADRKDKALKGEMPDPEWDAKWHAAAAGIWETIGQS